MTVRRSLPFGLILGAALTVLPVAGLALDLVLPGAPRQTAGQDLGLDSYALPIAPFDGETIPNRGFEGFVTRQAWRLDGSGVTPLQLLQPLREQLTQAGYKVLFECADRACGGFDFRFSTDVLNAPEMYVDLDDYRFLSALKGEPDKPSAAISLLVSRSSGASYVQVIQIAVDEAARINVTKGEALTPSTQGNTVPEGALASALGDAAKQIDLVGHAILNDLEFETGSSDLGAGTFASLEQIAAYLRANPARRIALVGHTDAVGGLEGNIALSKRRAASVRTRLIEGFGVAAAQLVAEGIGYLAPVASNLSPQGREANRRVEAVLISTE